MRNLKIKQSNNEHENETKVPLSLKSTAEAVNIIESY